MGNIVNFLTSNKFQEVQKTEHLKRKFKRGPYTIIYEDNNELSIHGPLLNRKSVTANDVIALVSYLRLSSSQKSSLRNKRFDVLTYYSILKEKYAENLSDIDKAFVDSYEECYREYLKS